jgi:Protein of unknown function (DUF3631)
MSLDIDFMGIAPEPKNGSDLLDQVEAFLARFVAFPCDAALIAVTLWAAHAHAVAAFESSPRLALLSPEPGSGKTRTLEILELLAPRTLLVLNASTAVTFRAVDAGQPTLLLDEVDTIFGRRTKDENEDLRGLLNAGHRRGAQVPRCVGPNHELKLFKVYAACALAGLGDLPETLLSRSVVVRMRRRAPGERLQPYRQRVHGLEGYLLRDRLAEWVEGVADDLHAAWPSMPAGVEDRPADVWEPLLAIADAAGGKWPARARDACMELVKVAAAGEGSLGVHLLEDLRTVFGDADALHTETILDALQKIDESPWGDLKGKPLTDRRLARLLNQYEAHSTTVKVAGKSLKGYRREDLYDAWTRYLPDSPLSVTSVTPAGKPALTSDDAGNGEGNPQLFGNVAEPVSVAADEPLTSTVTEVTEVTANPEPEPECKICGTLLLLKLPGRDTCERCRLDGERQTP